MAWSVQAGRYSTSTASPRVCIHLEDDLEMIMVRCISLSTALWFQLQLLLLNIAATCLKWLMNDLVVDSADLCSFSRTRTNLNSQQDIISGSSSYIQVPLVEVLSCREQMWKDSQKLRNISNYHRSKFGRREHVPDQPRVVRPGHQLTSLLWLQLLLSQ